MVENDIYFLTSKSFYQMARAVFFKQDSSFISGIQSSKNTDLFENTRIVVPPEAATMLIQAYGSASADVRLFKSDIAERIDNLETETNEIIDATTKITAGRKFARFGAAFVITFSINTLASRAFVIFFNEAAIVRMIIAGTIAQKPSGRHFIASLRLKMRRQI